MSLGSRAAKDMVFIYMLPPGAYINMWLSNYSFDSVHEMRYGGGCPGDIVVQTLDDPDNSPMSWRNILSDAQPVYYLLSGNLSTSAGAFGLHWEMFHEGMSFNSKACTLSFSINNGPHRYVHCIVYESTANWEMRSLLLARNFACPV